jgi:MscS family membrane protein
VRVDWSRLLRVALLLCVAPPANAQLAAIRPRQSAESVSTSTRSPDSPRALIEGFRRAARRGDWEGAAGALALSSAQRSRGAELAERLATVLDRRVTIDLDAMSGVAAGDTADGLDPARERVGDFEGSDGRPARVRLERIRENGEWRWLFSAATVAEIDAWYAALDGAWIRANVPRPLQRIGPLNVPWWQWLSLVLLLPVLALFAWGIGRGTKAALGAVTRRTPAEWDDVLLVALSGPFRLWIAALLARPLLAALSLNSGLLSVVDAAARGVAWVAFFWAGLRAIAIVQQRLQASQRLASAGQTRALIPLAGRVLRVTFVVLAVLMALAQFGYPVGTLLAGLGIGGIAIALAAQKTVEHLFGSVSLATDRTFGVGDFVRVDDIEGTVETIGLRSTQIRTADRTVIKFPNGRLAELRIETFGERDRMRFLAPFSLDVETPVAQLRRILADIEAMLRAHPLIWQGPVLVHLVSFGDAVINCRVLCWFQTTDAIVFDGIRSDMLLGIAAVVEQQGSTLAVANRTVRAEGEQRGRELSVTS